MVPRLPRSAEPGSGCSRVLRRGRTAAAAPDLGGSPAAAAPRDASRARCRSATGPQADPAATGRHSGSRAGWGRSRDDRAEIDRGCGRPRKLLPTFRLGGAVDLTGPARRDPSATRTDRARPIWGDAPLGAGDGDIGRTAGDGLALQDRKLRARPVLLPRPAQRPHANVALLLQGRGRRGGETAGMLAFLDRRSRRLGRFADAASSSRRR